LHDAPSSTGAGELNRVRRHARPFSLVVTDSTLAEVMKSVKGYSAKQIGRPIWQAGYHDHGVRAEHDLRHIARYIVVNPIRANLVQTIGDYPHWDTSYL
jgi:hypothetical protein